VIDARYYSISLELDPMGQPGTYKLTFSTMPGMSTSITELRMGDLDALARILGDRNDGLAVVEAIVAAPHPLTENGKDPDGS
jgi:hypothetical protein